MAVRAHESLKVVIEFLINDPTSDKPVFKNVTLSNVNETLTDAQIAQVIEKLAGLSKHTWSATYLVTKQLLMTE